MGCLAQSLEHGVMNKEAPTALILGKTGRTGIEKVTGRPATTFRAFAERNAHAWISEAK